MAPFVECKCSLNHRKACDVSNIEVERNSCHDFNSVYLSILQSCYRFSFAAVCTLFSVEFFSTIFREASALKNQLVGANSSRFYSWSLSAWNSTKFLVHMYLVVEKAILTNASFQMNFLQLKDNDFSQQLPCGVPTGHIFWSWVFPSVNRRCF